MTRRSGTSRVAYQYAVVQLVPDIERGERCNVGVVVHSREADFIGARTEARGPLVAALADGCTPPCDVSAIASRLELLERIAAGDPSAGPMARLSPSERYHALVAPSSTILQPAPGHTGLTTDPQGELDRLFGRLVARGSSPSSDVR